MSLKDNELSNPDFAIHKYTRLCQGELRRYGLIFTETLDKLELALSYRSLTMSNTPMKFIRNTSRTIRRKFLT